VESTSIPWIQVVAYLVVGAVAGVTAAWWPARRAAKLDVLHAISTE
jgi:putative ABC transport system permease protein